MNDRISDFLITLGEDRDLQRAYAADASAVMTAHGLSATEQTMILNGLVPGRVHAKLIWAPKLETRQAA